MGNAFLDALAKQGGTYTPPSQSGSAPSGGGSSGGSSAGSSSATSAYRNPLTTQYNNTANKLNLTVSAKSTNTKTETTKKSTNGLSVSNKLSTEGKSWVGETAKASAKGSGSGFLNTLTFLADLLAQSKRQQITPTQVATQVATNTLSGNKTDASAIEQVSARNQSVNSEENLSKTLDPLYQKADTMQMESATHTATAKALAGNTKLGNLATDVAVNAGQMAMEAPLNLIAPGGSLFALGTRVFGQASQEARQSGANQLEQLTYGTAKAAIEVATEKLFDGLAGLRGGGVADELVDNWVRTVANGSKLKTVLLTLGTSAAGEAAEEGIAGVLDPFAKAIYDNGNAAKNVFTAEGAKQLGIDTAYDMLVGGILGGFGGAGKVFRANASAVTTIEEQIATENTNGTQAQGTPTALQQILAKDSKYSKAASEIIHNPEALAEYEANYGKVEGNSVAEMERNLAAALYLTMNQGKVNMPQAPEGVQRNVVPDTPTTLPGAETANAMPSTLDGAVHPMAQAQMEGADPNTAGQIGAVMQIRQMQKNGISFSDANTIINDPVLRSVFEDITDIELSDNKKTAKQQIMDYAKSIRQGKNPLIVGEDMESYQPKHENTKPRQFGKHQGTTAYDNANPLTQGQHEATYTPRHLNGEVETTPAEFENPEYTLRDRQGLYGQEETVAPQTQTETQAEVVNDPTIYDNEMSDADVEALMRQNEQEQTAKAQAENQQNNPAETQAEQTQQNTPETETNATQGQNVQETQERGTTEQANTQNTQENAQNNPQVATTEVAREVAEQMKDLPPKERVAGNTENVITNNSMSEEVRNDVAQNPDKYNVLHNKDTLKRAIEIIDKNPDGWRGAVEELRNALAEAKNGKKIAPEFVPLTKILVNELYRTGNEVDRQTALQLNSDMAAELTWVGKFAQANAILRNADPITARMAIDKFIAKANKYLESKYGKNYKNKYTAALTQAEIERINATDFMAHPEELGNIIQDVSRRIGKEAPTSIKEKLLAISHGAMLSLPATHVGNFAANVPTAGMRKTNNFFAGVMQALDSKGIKLEGEQIPTQTQDGKWTAKVGDRTIVADTEQECKAIAVAEAYGRTRSAWASRQSTKVAREIYNGIKDNITEGTDKYGSPTSGYINQTMLKPLKISLFGKDIVNLTEWGTKNADKLTQIFKERFGVNAEDIFDASASQTYLNFIYWAMENEDKPFVRWAFVDSLASYCEARGITSAENVTEEAIAHATADALYYTYKNGNFISELISEIKHGKNKNPQTQAIADAFGMLAEHKLPFVTTLTNIGLMGIEHNPFTAGAKAVYEGAFLDANKTQVFDTLSKGFTGTLVIGLGMGLRSLGLLTGSGSEDDKRKKAWKRATGQQANSLLGKYDLSQLEPFVSLLSLGADLVDSYADPSNDDSPLQRLGNAITGSVNGFFGMEMMQNLAELFGEDSSYNSGNVAQDFIDSLSNDLPSRYIPNIWKGTVNAQDNTNRYFQYGDTWGERIVNAFKYYAGIDREKFPEKANVKGETSKGNPLTSAIDAMLYPGQINQGTMNEEDKFLEKMEKELGTTAVYPMQFYPGDEFTDSNTGEKVTLKAENTADFQKTYSNTYYSALAKLRTSDYFNSLDKDGKKAAISEVGSFSKDMAIAKAFESEGLEYTNDNAKLYYGDKEKDLPALGEDTLDYLIYKKIFDKSVDSKNYSTVEKQVAEFQRLPKNVRTVLFNKDSDVRGLVNAYDYGVKATDYFKYKDKLKTAADRYGTSTTNSTTKLSAIASAGLDNSTITSIIKNNVFDLSSTALAVVDVMSQPPYNIPLSQVADFIYQADYTMNQKYENNDIVDLGKKSVNKTTRMLAKSLDNGSLEKTDENIQRLFSALVMEDANVKGIGNGTANGTLGNLEVANALSTSSNPIIANNAEAIYNALRDKLSNYYNDWGNYSYKSEVNYLPKSAAKGYTYGRTIGGNALTSPLTSTQALSQNYINRLTASGGTYNPNPLAPK